MRFDIFVVCGIFAYSGIDQSAGKTIFSGLKSLEYRGYDSWGIALKRADNSIFIKKQVGKLPISTINFPPSNLGLGHTRWATHGGITQKNAHPHLDCTGKVVIVHNGIVENYQSLKHDLEKKGHSFHSQTDSEVIAHLIEQNLTLFNDRRRLIMSVFHQLTGLNAFIAFFPQTDEFFAIKNSSPLIFTVNEKTSQLAIASDLPSLSPISNKVYYLKDEELVTIKKNTFHIYSSSLRLIQPKFMSVDFYHNGSPLDNHPHYMIKEITEQPSVIINLITNQTQAINKAATLIKHAYGSYLIGCGSAYYAAVVGSYLFSIIAKRHINHAIASEFNYCEQFLTPQSLVIALSQSGETIDTIASIKKAKQNKATIMSITNSPGSTIYQLSDVKLLLNAGPEKCVLATKSFTAKVALLYLLAYAVQGKITDGIKSIKTAVVQMRTIINTSYLTSLAQTLINHPHIYILGRGLSYPAALESALKIKEASYIHAEAFAGGELKHGVIALIDNGTPVIVFNPEDETYNDSLSSAHEVKARGAYVIGISSKPNSVYDQFIYVKNCRHATILPNIIIAQLLGYYLALAKGYDPDKPRNLAKSVTVK